MLLNVRVPALEFGKIRLPALHESKHGFLRFLRFKTLGKGFAFGLSGERFDITGNTIRFEEHEGKYPAGLMTIGFGKLAGRDMGASLVDSVYANNTIEGKVRDFGIVFRPGSADMPNVSHGNRFDLGDSVARLGAKATLTLSKDVFCNTFTGSLGTVVDHSPEDANEYES